MCYEWFSAADVLLLSSLLSPYPPPGPLYLLLGVYLQSCCTTCMYFIDLCVVCPLLQVLILLPMRNMALKCILRLLQFTQKETRADSIQGKRRLLDDFGPGETTYTCACIPAEHDASGVYNTLPVCHKIALSSMFQYVEDIMVVCIMLCCCTSPS